MADGDVALDGERHRQPDGGCLRDEGHRVDVRHDVGDDVLLVGVEVRHAHRAYEQQPLLQVVTAAALS